MDGLVFRLKTISGGRRGSPLVERSMYGRDTSADTQTLAVFETHSASGGVESLPHCAGMRFEDSYGLLKLLARSIL